MTIQRDPVQKRASGIHTVRRHGSVEAGGATAVGRQRHHNEDQYVIASFVRSLELQESSVNEEGASCLPDGAEGTLLVVADGMGGMGGGDVASKIAVRATVDYLCSVLPWFDTVHGDADPTSLPGVRAGLTQAVEHGDRQVRQAARAGEGARQMGTTLTIAYVHFPTLYVAHVGDTRCYRLRGSELTRLTRDHTVAEQLRNEVDIPLETETQWDHMLYNAVGGAEEKGTVPDLIRDRLEPDDVLCLCSDGLTKHVSRERVAEVLRGCTDPRGTARQLVDEADQAGGSDNITVVVARCSPWS